jgi:integrase
MGRKKEVKLGWGEGSVRQRRDRWQVRWRENGARQSLSGFDSKAAALEELDKIKARLTIGQPGIEREPPPRPRSKAIPDLVEEWRAHKVQHGRRMASEDKARWQLHLAQPLETQTIESVTAKWVRDLAAELVSPTLGSKRPDGAKKEKVSGPTADRILTLLSSFLQWCVDEGLLIENVARIALRHKDTKKLLKPRSDETTRKEHLKNWAEVDALYKKLDAPVSILYLLSARCGLRPGEAVALRWGDVDFDASAIRIQRQARHGKVGPTKGDRARDVPMVPVVAKELRAWFKKSTKPTTNDIEREQLKKALVCPPVRGGFVGPKAITKALDAGFPKAKLPAMTMYEAGRHTFGTLTGLGGISAWRLQAIMGHQDIKTTLHYVHAADHELGAAELKALGG